MRKGRYGRFVLFRGGNVLRQVFKETLKRLKDAATTEPGLKVPKASGVYARRGGWKGVFFAESDS